MKLIEPTGKVDGARCSRGRRRAAEPRGAAPVQAALRAAPLPRGGGTGTVGGSHACRVRVQALASAAGGGSEQRVAWRVSARVSCVVPARRVSVCVVRSVLMS